MKILITGATGFIGRALVPKLTIQGHEVYALVRNPDRARSMLGTSVNCFTRLEDMQGQKFDAVINLAGEPIVDKRWTEARKQTLRSSRIDLTQQLASFLASQAHKPGVILSGSAIGYYGSQPSDVSLDEASTHAPGFTHDLCADWEAAALSMASDSTRVCLLRTGVVLGKGGGALSKMLLPFKLGLGGPIGDGQQVMSWIHLQDWINAALFLLTHNELSGPFNLTSPNPVNNKMFTKALAGALHRPAFFRVPCCTLKLMMGEAAELLCQGQRVVPRKLLDAGYQFVFPDIDQALAEIVSAGN